MLPLKDLGIGLSDATKIIGANHVNRETTQSFIAIFMT